jgi:hypothetical protein
MHFDLNCLAKVKTSKLQSLTRIYFSFLALLPLLVSAGEIELFEAYMVL